MKKILLKIYRKLMSYNENQILEVPSGITTAELLDLINIKGEKDQVLVIYNGRPVFLDEVLDQDGEIIIMPVLAGG